MPDSENVRLKLILPDKFITFFKEKKKIALILVLVSLGLMLVALSSIGQEAAPDGTSLSEYKADLEKRLEKLCSEVDGVGKCSVMITFSRGEENTYKGNQLTESKPPRVLGVTVVCDGGDRTEVRARLSQMLCVLFDIGSNRVAVLPSKN